MNWVLCRRSGCLPSWSSAVVRSGARRCVRTLVLRAGAPRFRRGAPWRDRRVRASGL